MFFVSEDGIDTESTPELATYCFEYRTPDLSAESWSGGSEKAESNWSGAEEASTAPTASLESSSTVDVLRTALGRFKRHDSLPVSALRSCSAAAVWRAARWR